MSFQEPREAENAVATPTATTSLTTRPNAKNVVTTTKQKVSKVLVVAGHE